MDATRWLHLGRAALLLSTIALACLPDGVREPSRDVESGVSDVGAGDEAWEILGDRFVVQDIGTNLLSGCSDGETAYLDLGGLTNWPDGIRHRHRSYQLRDGRIRPIQEDVYSEPASTPRRPESALSRRFCSVTGEPSTLVRIVHTSTLAAPRVTLERGPLGVTIRERCVDSRPDDFVPMLGSEDETMPGVFSYGCLNACPAQSGVASFSLSEESPRLRSYCSFHTIKETDGVVRTENLDILQAHPSHLAVFARIERTTSTGTTTIDSSVTYAYLTLGSDGLDLRVELPRLEAPIVQLYFVPHRHAFVIQRFVGWRGPGDREFRYSWVPSLDANEQSLPEGWPAAEALAPRSEFQQVGPDRLGLSSGSSMIITDLELRPVGTIPVSFNDLVLRVADKFLVFTQRGGPGTTIDIRRHPAF